MKNATEAEKEKITEQKWQKRVEDSVKAQCQLYSCNFDMDPKLTEKEKDIERLKLKMTDPYTYF